MFFKKKVPFFNKKNKISLNYRFKKDITNP